MTGRPKPSYAARMTRKLQGVLPAVEIEPQSAARHAVIWLHGLGANGHDFPPIVPELGLGDGLAIRWVFPHAPSIPVTINGGMVMPAWYDITSLDFRSRRHDEAGIRASIDALTRLIERENERGVPCERILLAGFSQGGAIALSGGLRHAERLAGIIGLSTFLPLHEELERERAPANAATPIFVAHGSLDPMVPFESGQLSRERLRALGYQVEWHEYPMLHQVCLEEIRDLGAWMSERCASS